MSNLFIFSTSYLKKIEDEDSLKTSVTVIFHILENPNIKDLQAEIKQYYEENYQTDEIVILCGCFNSAVTKDIFIEKQLDVFKYIPKIEEAHLKKTTHILNFDRNGNLTLITNNEFLLNIEFIKKINGEGLLNIFKNRGGLIEATGDAHHFVFPSGKHCNKFLRTGNILLYSNEIFFIAYNLLNKFNANTHKEIYCDTSSINALAFALLDLVRKFDKDIASIPIKSFSSYEGILKGEIKFFDSTFLLISSSTSGNIIKKLREKHTYIQEENIAIIYYLGKLEDFKKNESKILCNLTYSEENINGIQFYDTYTETDCIHCYSGSYPVSVKGDVFLLEKPKINKILLQVTDAPNNLSQFVKSFISKKRNENILKVNYKENNSTTRKYEIYFDMYRVLTDLQEPNKAKNYIDFREKLNAYIDQYIPHNTKYFITLPDEGSEKLFEIIEERISKNKSFKEVKFDDVDKKIINEEEEGAVVILASCISNGKNLLFLSRTLRRFEKLRLVYFVGLARTNNEEYLETLKLNLKLGKYGQETHTFIAVEKFYCNKDLKNTSWLIEKDFFLTIKEEQQDLSEEQIEFINNRINIIDESLSKDNKGLANHLFFPNTRGRELELRKGFAFFKFQNYVKDVSQADVYFTINSIINKLRFNKENSKTLRQSEFVRNILDVNNFNRFNDGVIQSSLLRSAYPSELSYQIDNELSQDMFEILEKIIDNHDSPQGEALLEFLYAIAIGKLKLKNDCLIRICELLDGIDNEIVKLFSSKIKSNNNEPRKSLLSKFDNLKN